MSLTERIKSYQDFWPYYLSEHRTSSDRALHFVGTTGFFASCVASTIANPIFFPPALAAMYLIGRDAVKREPEGRPLAHVGLMVILPTMAAPFTFLPGVAWAYGCAWTGHFVIEKNRPATFHYPVWSLASDFKMWGHMARGKLWSGDPLQELGLEDKWGGAQLGQPSSVPNS